MVLMSLFLGDMLRDSPPSNSTQEVSHDDSTDTASEKQGSKDLAELHVSLGRCIAQTALLHLWPPLALIFEDQWRMTDLFWGSQEVTTTEVATWQGFGQPSHSLSKDQLQTCYVTSSAAQKKWTQNTSRKHKNPQQPGPEQ